MSKDFPFTNYDFYAYLASGLFFLFWLDMFLTGGVIFHQQSWNFVQISLVVAASYIAGQILAIPSSTVVEHFLLNVVFRKPLVIQTGSKAPRWHERILGGLIGRYYEPLPSSTREKLLARAREATGKEDSELLTDPESIFHPAFVTARADEDTRNRLDDFRNQYGFARNICFVGIVVLALGLWLKALGAAAIILLLILIVGMFLRYAKFYAAFCADVLRALAYAPKKESTKD